MTPGLIRTAPFVVLLSYWVIQSLTLGISDDEAYYWVLSRTPALGYVYHPPMVSWIIALVESLVGWLPLPREFLVRVGGIVLTAGSLLIGIRWLQVAGEDRAEHPSTTLPWLIVPGMAATGWMMVPDHSLIFGLLLSLLACTHIVRSQEPSARDLWLLALGAFIGLLSKFSAILYCASAAATILLLSRRKLQPLAALATGVIAASVPILIWNSQNDWAALVYQFHSRHSGGTWNLRRYLTFWISQFFFAGPFLLSAAVIFLTRVGRRLRSLDFAEKILILWLLPATVFLIQPAYSDFKPHWALVAWIPVGLALGLRTRHHPVLTVLHRRYSVLLLILALSLTQLPVTSWITQKWTGSPANPLWDVSNDLRGWSELPRFLAETGFSGEVPVVGSRYQTASQAAFALWPVRNATLSPKTRAETREWPVLENTLEEASPGSWPRLRAPVLYVQDDRYVQSPEFHGSDCQRIGSIGTPRLGAPPKKIHIWSCLPLRP